MRKIKFRAWLKDAKEIIEVEDIQFKDEIKLMQYVGIKDKHNKEIYEGDIVKWKSLGYDMFNKDKINIAVVEYDDKACGFRPFINIEKSLIIHEEHEKGELLCKIKYNGYYEFEVIGNIYENPELLKMED